MQETDAVAAQLGALQSFGLRLGSAREPRLRQLDQRADDVRLPARIEVHAQALVRLARPLGADTRGDDRLAVRRRLRDLAHREVAVDRQRERARDRRRGHVQHVRRAILGERGSLLDAEAVLLVDDGDRQICELDVALDQRVRADCDLRDTVRDLVPDLLRADRAGEQHAAHAELRAERLERQEVLLGERLRRRHQRALPARLDRPQQRVERDDGLAGADVALQQALHRRRLRQVEVDLGDRALLVLGQLRTAARRGSGRSARPAARATARRRRSSRSRATISWSVDELVEREPPPGLPRPASSSTGKWIAARASRAQRQLELGRQRIGEACARVARAPRARARAAASTGSARSPGTPARSRPCGAPRRCRSSSRRSRSGRACRADAGCVPATQLLGEPRLVEERRADLAAAVVADDRGHERPSATEGPRASADYSTLDRDFALGEAELRDRDLVDRALVPARRVEEQVAHRLDAERAQPFRERRADSGQRRRRRARRAAAAAPSRAAAASRAGPHL